MTAETTQGGGQSPEPGSDEWYDQLGELVANNPTPRHRPNRTKAAPLPPAPDPAPGVTGLKPCPFCGAHLEKSEAFSNRSSEAFTHPIPESDDGDRCVLSGAIVRSNDKERLAAWNRRSHNAALSEAVGALEAIRHMSSPAKRIDEPRLRLDAVSDLAAATLSRLKSSTGGGEP